MSKPVLRTLLTILIYFGVLVFLYPYLTGHLYNGVIFLIGGAALTVVSGLSRCLLTEGDCGNTPVTKPAP
jgi:hypothetical protein